MASGGAQWIGAVLLAAGALPAQAQVPSAETGAADRWIPGYVCSEAERSALLQQGPGGAIATLPVRDCTLMDEVLRERPVWELTVLPPLPPRLCSEAQREAYRRRMKALAAAVQAQIGRQSSYREQVSRHVTLFRALGPAMADLDLITTHMAIERDWATDADKVQADVLVRVRGREEALDSTPMADCAKPLSAGDAVPYTPPAPSLVPERPALPAEPRAIPPRPVCSERERVGLLAEYDKVIRVADARMAMANVHGLQLGQTATRVGRSGAGFDQIAEVTREARAYQPIVQALHKAALLWRSRRAVVAGRPLDMCETLDLTQGLVAS